ncbi:MAG: hypothetical protein H0X17_07055 [Deltaproteobacteria bacterium]|nr:hypothetical protein [Deltaproteobacteria bacterium]
MRTTTLALLCVMFAGCAWGSGSPSGGDDGPTPDAATGAPVCGDSICASVEIGSCTADCGANRCGNSVCDTGETSSTCAADCPATGPVCGDGTCDMAGGESSSNCAGDCSASGGTCPADPLECFPCLLDPMLCPTGLDQAACTACITMMP